MANPGHEENVCHSIGEMRGEKVNQVRRIIDLINVEEEQEKMEELKRRDYMKSVRNKTADNNLSLIDVPEYWYRAALPPKGVEIPTITSSPCLTVRYTGNKKALSDQCTNLRLKLIKDENPHPEAPWQTKRKSVEIRAGRTFQGCDCIKFNGLQDRCQRSECQNNPECLTKPYPNCPPSSSYPGPRRYKKPTTVASQTEPPCCNCKIDGNSDVEYRAEGCQCRCHSTPSVS